MTAFTIDSSVFLSSLLNDDSHRNESVFFLSFLRNQQPPVAIPWLVVAEVINVLIRHRVREPEILLRSFKKYTVVNLDDNFIRLALMSRWKQISLKTSDAMVALTSAAYRTTLVSWDEKLIAEAGKITKTATPSDFMR